MLTSGNPPVKNTGYHLVTMRLNCAYWRSNCYTDPLPPPTDFTATFASLQITQKDKLNIHYTYKSCIRLWTYCTSGPQVANRGLHLYTWLPFTALAPIQQCQLFPNCTQNCLFVAHFSIQSVILVSYHLWSKPNHYITNALRISWNKHIVKVRKNLHTTHYN